MAGLGPLLTTAAGEADVKGVGLREAADSLVAFAHMLKVYDPVEMAKLYPGLSYLSIRSPQSLKRITTAAGYHIPATTAGLEVDPIQEMVLQTGLERAGVLNTQSGTWLREMALRALPTFLPDNPSKSQVRYHEQHQAALKELGLVDEAGKPTWFTGGKPDELKMLKSVAEHAPGIPVERRALLERFLFGAQGAGAVGVLSDPRLLPQLGIMEQEAKGYKAGTDYFKYMHENSPVQQFNQAWIELQKVLMDIGSVALPPLLVGLQGVDGIFKSISADFPKKGELGGLPAKGTLGEALGKGMAEGAIIGAPLGFAAGALGGLGVGAIPGAGLGAAFGAFAGGTYEGGKFIINNFPAMPSIISPAGAAEMPPMMPYGGPGPGLSYSPPPPPPASFNDRFSGRQSFNAIPPPTPTPVHIEFVSSLNIDGQRLADIVQEKIADMMEFPNSAPFYNGRAGFTPNDAGVVST